MQGAPLRRIALIDSFLCDDGLHFLQLSFIRQIFRAYNDPKIVPVIPRVFSAFRGFGPYRGKVISLKWLRKDKICNFSAECKPILAPREFSFLCLVCYFHGLPGNRETETFLANLPVIQKCRKRELHNLQNARNLRGRKVGAVQSYPMNQTRFEGGSAHHELSY
jgi:hypothetical protein